MDPRIEVRARPVYLMLVVLCAAIGIAIVFMAGIALVIARDVAAAQASVTSLPLAIFLALGAGAVAAALAARRSFLASALSASSIDEALARIRTGTIVACAFSEAPAVLGLAYLVLGGDTVWAPVFFGGALVSLALVFPRPSQWEEWLSAVVDASAQRPYEGPERRGTDDDG